MFKKSAGIGRNLMIAILGIGTGLLIYFMLNAGEGSRVNRALKNSIGAIDVPEVTLEDAIPFEWEEIYFIAPNASRSDVEAEIGLRSENIGESTEEGMLNIIFVNKGEVIAGIVGLGKNLGYDIRYGNFPATFNGEKKLTAKVRFGDKTKFKVIKEDGYQALQRLSPVPALEEAFGMTEEELKKVLIGAKEEEIFGEWGQAGPLSGRYGFVWTDEKQEKRVAVYFDREKKIVTDVKTGTGEDTK